MSLLGRALGAFTAWALDKHPVTSGSSTAPVRFGAYTIKGDDGAPYMTRVLFPRVLGFRPMLHNIHRPDHDRDLHNHPWSWAFSVLLSGSYREQRDDIDGHSCDHTYDRLVRRFNFLRGSTWHRISELHGDVWTLFVSGPRLAGWGFREWDTTYEGYVVTDHAVYTARRKAERDPRAFVDAVFAAEGSALDALLTRHGVERRETGEDEYEDDAATRGYALSEVLSEYEMTQLGMLSWQQEE